MAPSGSTRIIADIPASSAQQRFWLLNELAASPGSLTVSLGFRLEGQIQEERLAAAIVQVVQRHEALRSGFFDQGGEVRQAIFANAIPAIDYADLRHHGPQERMQLERQLILTNRVFDFRLERAPLLAGKIVRSGAFSWLLLLAVHHIAIDAWSLRIILREISQAYADPASLSPPQCQYREVVEQEGAWASTPDAAAQMDYWRMMLEAAPSRMALPGQASRPSRRGYLADTIPLGLTKPAGAQIDDLARELGCTRFMVLLAALARFLQQTTGESDVLVGTPSGGRDDPNTEAAVGPVLNTIALRMDASPALTFRELVLAARDVTLSALDHARIPFDRVVSAVGPVRDTSYAPLCQIMLITQSDFAGDLSIPGTETTRLIDEPSQCTSELDLTFVVGAAPGSSNGLLEYAQDLYDEQQARDIANLYCTILDQCLAAPDRLYAQSRGAKNRESANADRAHRPQSIVSDTDGWERKRCVHDLVTESARKYPEKIAIESDESLSYAELDRRSELAARGLRKRGVCPETRVGLCMRASAEAWIAILAIMRAGGVYVPLDPDYPEERLRLMHDDSAPVCVIGPRDWTKPSLNTVWVTLEELIEVSSDGAGCAEERIDPDNLAYIVYTSGSTGVPKGVAVPHASLSNLIEWQSRRSGSVRTLQFASLNFDVSLSEAFSTWAAGGTLVLLPPKGRQDLVGVASLLRTYSIQRLFIPVVALNEISRICIEDRISLPSLGEVIVAGEQLVIDSHVRQWFIDMPATTLENQYGTTENILATAYRLPEDPGTWPRVPPIGSPIPGVRVTLVPTADNEDDEVGELYLGGACLSRGYIGREELTRERYVADPGGSGLRMYRTGDLARLREGLFEFVGRGDDQIKVRGHRVELGELEATLRRHPSVHEAAALAIRRGGRPSYLVAAVVGPSDIELGEMARWLADQLPPWMVPARVKAVSAIPLTPSGKTNRTALETSLSVESVMEGIPPQNDMELKLAQIWREVLDLPSVGITDDFVSLGGDSVAAARLVGRVRRQFCCDFAVASAFTHRTIAEQVLEISGSSRRASGTAT